MSSTKPNNLPLFALIDCNNFYVSCERVFNPRLWNKPVVILSSNDGCVIARSNEAKALGIPMGAPAFQYDHLFKSHHVIVQSSNFTLYGDMSYRVMETLAQFSADMEIYSIDEAFLLLEKAADAQNIKKIVYQWTGIPVSVGIASTKTLAKLANRYAKKYLPLEPYFLLDESNRAAILKKFTVEDVWGIGRQISSSLRSRAIYTAWDLCQLDDAWIKKRFSVVVLRTVWELRGISCLPLQEVAASKKSIVCSRSFSSDITQKEELAEALSDFTARAAEKLRKQGSLASFVEVFLNTNRFKEGCYFNAAQVVLQQPTDYTPRLIHSAKNALHRIFKEGLAYKKIGVLLGGIISGRFHQQDFLYTEGPPLEKQEKLMQLMDQTNAKYKKNMIRLAAQGVEGAASRRSCCSDRYTTNWDNILLIHL